MNSRTDYTQRPYKEIACAHMQDYVPLSLIDLIGQWSKTEQQVTRCTDRVTNVHLSFADSSLEEQETSVSPTFHYRDTLVLYCNLTYCTYVSL